MTVISSFAVGLLFSATSTYYISNSLRDRKLLCREKYDDESLKAYYYELQLKERVLREKAGYQNPYYESTRKVISEKVVPAVQQAANKVFSFNGKEVKEFVDSVLPKKEE